MGNHAFTARTEAVDSTPAASFFVGCSVAPLLGPFRTRKAGATCLACQNSSGAKHRSCTTTKLNGRSCLHCTHRSRGLDPRCKLLRRLLGRTIARAFSHTQSGGNLLGVCRLQEVLEVAVFREDIVERLVHNIVGGCVDESGVLIDLLSGGFIQPNRSTDVAALVDFK